MSNKEPSNLEKWFDKEARQLVFSTKWGFSVNSVDLKLTILSIRDQRIPKWFREIAHRLEIQFIVFRPGEEANYIGFLTHEMEKVHETYLVNLETFDA